VARRRQGDHRRRCTRQRAVRGGAGDLLGRARRDVRLAAGLAAAGNELGARTARCLGVDGYGGARAQVLGEAEERGVPADAGPAVPVLVPHVEVVDRGDVFEPQARTSVGVVTQLPLDPADRAPEFPRHVQVSGWVAGGHLTGGVALELVVAADPQVTRETLARRHGVGSRVDLKDQSAEVDALGPHGRRQRRVAHRSTP
jgi:hypothetical protein